MRIRRRPWSVFRRFLYNAQLEAQHIISIHPLIMPMTLAVQYHPRGLNNKTGYSTLRNICNNILYTRNVRCADVAASRNGIWKCSTILYAQGVLYTVIQAIPTEKRCNLVCLSLSNQEAFSSNLRIMFGDRELGTDLRSILYTGGIGVITDAPLISIIASGPTSCLPMLVMRVTNTIGHEQLKTAAFSTLRTASRQRLCCRNKSGGRPINGTSRVT